VVRLRRIGGLLPPLEGIIRAAACLPLAGAP